MAKEKARLSQLAKELKDPAPAKPRRKPKTLEPNPERGMRGDFLKVAITMPVEMLTQVKVLGLRRRAAGQKDTDVSSLFREAMAEFLKKGD